MPLFEEELLEPIARYFRYISGVGHIVSDVPISIVDLGCGPELRFYRFLRSRNIEIEKYYGIDGLISKKNLRSFENSKAIKLVTKPIVRKIPLKNNSVDFVVAFAFFEHIDYPKEILVEAFRVLKPGGKVILTVPSDMAQPFLEFMSDKLKIISRREIEEHKNYFDKNKLLELLPKEIKKSKVFHKYFEFGLNNLMVVEK